MVNISISFEPSLIKPRLGERTADEVADGFDGGSRVSQGRPAAARHAVPAHRPRRSRLAEVSRQPAGSPHQASDRRLNQSRPASRERIPQPDDRRRRLVNRGGALRTAAGGDAAVYRLQSRMLVRMAKAVVGKQSRRWKTLTKMLAKMQVKMRVKMRVKMKLAKMRVKHERGEMLLRRPTRA